MWQDVKKFRAWGDTKPGLVCERIAAVFSTVTELQKKV